MKQHLFAIPLMALAMAPIPSLANLALAQKHACTACHAVDTKLVGPAYADVAKKYKGQKNAEATLIANIKKGGSGKWGAVPMPAQTTLSDADAKTLAKWILSIAK
ncbi:MAG: cytochrome C [Curvibacter sp. GWA2_64_110]|nr:MAG: cytochrome C [Curvibacter sp. GWA2_64_110]HCY15449.1 cytochrome C [Curvibacter sp.]